MAELVWDQLSSLILKFRFIIVLFVGAMTFCSSACVKCRFSVERKILPSTHENS